MVRRRRFNRKKRQDALGVLIFVICACLAASVGYIYFVTQKNKLVIDETTLCPENIAFNTTAILIDQSDPFTPIQQLELRTKLMEVKSNIPKHHKLSIYTITDTLDAPATHRLSVCNPGDGKDSNPLISNPALIKEKWIEGFSNKVDNIIEDVTTSNELKKSPIMEAIRFVAINEFSQNDELETPNNLFIISDMLQYNDTISHYKKDRDYSSFFNSNYYHRYLSDLNNVRIIVFYLSNEQSSFYQTKNHVLFWQDYFHKSGGLLTSVVRISN